MGGLYYFIMSMNNIDKDAQPTKFLWMDLEMTGLDPDVHRIVEVGIEVTDLDFKTLASYEAVVYQPEDILENMHEWSKDQHGKSGLTERIRRDGRPEKDVIHEVVGFIKAQFGDEPAILAGNSIHNDRFFIRKQWQEVEDLLHYRMLDVSSFKVLMESKYGIEFEKDKAHRAFDDIQASIAELQHYLQMFRL